MDSQNNNTIIHRSAIKWASSLVRNIQKSVQNPNFKWEDWLSDQTYQEKAHKYLSVISPQLDVFDHGFHLFFVIVEGKFPEFGKTQSKIIKELEIKILEEAQLLKKALNLLLEGSVLNDYYSFRIGHFCQRFISYCGHLNYWQQLKYQFILEFKIKEYWGAKLEHDQLEKEPAEKRSNEIKRRIETLKHKMEHTKQELTLLGADSLIEKFKPVEIDWSQVSETFHKAYWDLFTEDIQSGKLERIVDLMDEIKNMMMACYPNRPDKHQYLNDSLDSELIKQMIQYKAIKDSDIQKYVMFILNEIKSLQKPADDSEWLTWKSSVEEELQKLKQLEKSQTMNFWSNFFPSFFQKAFKRMEEIHKDISEFKKSQYYAPLTEAVKEKHEQQT